MTDQTPTTTKALGVTFSGSNKKGQGVRLTDDDALKRMFNTEHDQTANGLLRHCLKVLGNNEVSEDFAGNDERLFMMNAIADITPQDSVERMLSVQMAATHVAIIRMGRLMANAKDIAQSQAYNNGYTKLTRAYTAQMEALRKHRNGGKQTVTVQHVNVEGGGQAIVGNVQMGGGHT